MVRSRTAGVDKEISPLCEAAVDTGKTGPSCETREERGGAGFGVRFAPPPFGSSVDKRGEEGRGANVRRHGDVRQPLWGQRPTLTLTDSQELAQAMILAWQCVCVLEGTTCTQCVVFTVILQVSVVTCVFCMPACVRMCVRERTLNGGAPLPRDV